MGYDRSSTSLYGFFIVLVFLSSVLTAGPFFGVLLATRKQKFVANVTEVSQWYTPLIDYVQHSPGIGSLYSVRQHALDRSVAIADNGVAVQLSVLHSYIAPLRTALTHLHVHTPLVNDFTYTVLCVVGNLLSAGSSFAVDVIAKPPSPDPANPSNATIRISGFVRMYDDSDVLLRVVAPHGSPIESILRKWESSTPGTAEPFAPKDATTVWLHFGRRVPVDTCTHKLRSMGRAAPYSAAHVNSTEWHPLIPSTFFGNLSDGEPFFTLYHAVSVRPPDGGGRIDSSHPLSEGLYGKVDPHPNVVTASEHLQAWSLWNVSSDSFGGFVAAGLVDMIGQGHGGSGGEGGGLLSNIYVHVLRRMRPVYLNLRMDALYMFEALDMQVQSLVEPWQGETLTAAAVMASPPPVPTEWGVHTPEWKWSDRSLAPLRRKWLLCQLAVFGMTVSPHMQLVGFLAERDCAEHFPPPQTDGRVVWSPARVLQSMRRVGQLTIPRALELTCGPGKSAGRGGSGGVPNAPQVESARVVGLGTGESAWKKGRLPPRGVPKRSALREGEDVEGVEAGVESDGAGRVSEGARGTFGPTFNCEHHSAVSLEIEYLAKECVDLFDPLPAKCVGPVDGSGAVPLVECLAARCGGRGLMLAEGVTGRPVAIRVSEGKVVASGMYHVSLIDMRSFFRDFKQPILDRLCSPLSDAVAEAKGCDSTESDAVCDLLTGVDARARYASLHATGVEGGMREFVCALSAAGQRSRSSHIFKLLSVGGGAVVLWMVVLLVIAHFMFSASQRLWNKVFDCVHRAVLCPWQSSLWTGLGVQSERVVVSELQPLILWWRAAASQIKARWLVLPYFARFLLARNKVMSSPSLKHASHSAAIDATTAAGAVGLADVASEGGKSMVESLMSGKGSDVSLNMFGVLPMVVSAGGSASLPLGDLTVRPPAAVAVVDLRLPKSQGIVGSAVPTAAPILARTLSSCLVPGAFIVWLPSFGICGEDPQLSVAVAIPHTASVRDAARTLHRIVTRVASALVARFESPSASSAPSLNTQPPGRDGADPPIRGYVTIGVALRSRTSQPSTNPFVLPPSNERGIVFMGQSTAAQRAFSLSRLGCALGVLHGTVLADDTFVRMLVPKGRMFDEMTSFTPFDLVSSPAPQPTNPDGGHSFPHAVRTDTSGAGKSHPLGDNVRRVVTVPSTLSIRHSLASITSDYSLPHSNTRRSNRFAVSFARPSHTSSVNSVILWAAPAQISVPRSGPFFRQLADALALMVNRDPRADVRLRKLVEDYQIPPDADSLWSLLSRATDAKLVSTSEGVVPSMHIDIDVGFVEPLSSSVPSNMFASTHLSK